MINYIGILSAPLTIPEQKILHRLPYYLKC